MSPSIATTLPAATDTNAASKPYSTAVAPLSSLMNLRMSVVIIARHSSYLASHGDESTGGLNGRCSNIVDGSRRAIGASCKLRHLRHFPQSSHELEPLHLCRFKTSLATALKYSVTINACLIGRRPPQGRIARALRRCTAGGSGRIARNLRHLL